MVKEKEESMQVKQEKRAISLILLHRCCNRKAIQKSQIYMNRQLLTTLITGTIRNVRSPN